MSAQRHGGPHADLARIAQSLQVLLASVGDDVDRAAEAAERIIAVLQDLAEAQLRLLLAIAQHHHAPHDVALPDVAAAVREVLADVAGHLDAYRPPPLDHHALS